MAVSLGLEPHPEGGYYLETYRAAQTLRTPRGERPASTAILFLVTAESVSRLHRLSSDELWVYQGGLPLELVTIAPDGVLLRRVLGDLDEAVRGSTPTTRRRRSPGDCGAPGRPSAGDRLASAGAGAGRQLAGRPPGGRPAAAGGPVLGLVSCVVTPGFDFADFELGDRDALLVAHPEHAEIVRELT